MKDKELKNIVGESFEDMSIAEMTKVQGSGFVFLSTTACGITMIASGAVSASLSMNAVKTIKKLKKDN